jgi:hypothetical protein
MARDSQGSRRCSTPTASWAVDVYAEPHADPSGQTELVKAFVLVGGWPGSGKTTLEPVDVVALAQVIRATVERGGRG